MSAEGTRSFLGGRIGSRAAADAKEDGDRNSANGTSAAGFRDRSWYGGCRSGDDSSYGSLRKVGLSAAGVSSTENGLASSAKRNGHTASPGGVSVSSGSSPSTGLRYSTSTYVPIGKRLHNPYLADSTGTGKEDPEDDKISSASRREVREAFLRGETPRYDPALRERDNLPTKTDREKDKERQSHISHHGSTDRPLKGGPKEIVAEGYVGFVNLPNQVYRKAVKRGFDFTLMVVGESGLGKSTLINSMFLTDLYNNEYPGPSHRVKKTIQVETTQVVLKEGGVQLKLTVVDTPGFGDAVDNSNCWQPIIDHIEARYEDYLNAESRVHRSTLPDLRVHCCLYFISPNGHGLKPLDLEFMKRLHDKVNIIPLIAKADTMTPQECRDFKKTILNEIAQNKIRIYEFPDPDDEEEAKLQKKLKDRVPFAIIGSNTVVESGGRKVRGRVYPWGTVEVENLEHNDFIALRNMLIRTHMQDLKDVTNNVHYENFRYNKLVSVTPDGKLKSAGKSPLLQLDEERKEQETKLKKAEAEMSHVFEMKVKEKRNRLKESEADLERKAEQMRKTQEQQEQELKERIAAFEKEQKQWQEQERLLHEQMRTLEKEKTKRKGIF